MKNKDIDELFEAMDFDIAEPEAGHEQRFQNKLNKKSKGRTKSSGIIAMWLPGLAIAASFLIVFLLFQEPLRVNLSNRQDLAMVSSEMKTTQDFYASVIKKELYHLQQEKTPATEAIVQDALKQLDILEQDYQKLKTDLTKSGQDKRVISAMISNFQKRIDLLNTVQEKVNNINALNKTSHENNML